jgi:hypothetical protein
VGLRNQPVTQGYASKDVSLHLLHMLVLSMLSLPVCLCLHPPAARYTVPVLWDKKEKTIVNNESSEVLRILNSAFNSLGGWWGLHICLGYTLVQDTNNQFMRRWLRLNSNFNSLGGWRVRGWVTGAGVGV